MNDNDLKQLLAKMLPETVEDYGGGALLWRQPIGTKGACIKSRVKDTELLHLCSLVEAGLTVVESCTYFDLLRSIEPDNEAAGAFAYHATWQQRVTALAVVKGVTL